MRMGRQLAAVFLGLLRPGNGELDWQWTSQRGSSAWDYATALQLDASGNVVVAGDATGPLDNHTYSGSRDIFLMKFSGSGSWQWTRQRGTEKSDNARALQIDPHGSILVAGYTSSSMDGNVHAGGSDIFVSKYDQDGSWLWTRQRGSSEMDYARALQLDPWGNIIVAGYTGGALDGNSNSGEFDFFVTKLDANGAWRWTRQRGSKYWDYARALRLDAAGNIFVAGYTRGDLDGNRNRGGKDAFLAKFDSEGLWQWTKQEGGAGDDDAMDLGIAASGHILLTGETSSALQGQRSGSSDVFLIKFDGAGAREWTQQRGTDQYDVPWALEIDRSNNVLVAGYTGGSMDGHENAGSADMFVMRFDPAGSWQWTEQRGTPFWDYARALKVNAAGDVFLAGSTQGRLDGDDHGREDIFVMKFKGS